MSTFICEKCGCIDNSAMDNNYWERHRGKKEVEPALCTECSGNKWHDKFPKKHWSEFGRKAEIIVEAQKGKGNYDNAVEYFGKEDKK